MEPILGIDLGTTNSVVSIIRDGVPTVVPVEGTSPILPSVVGLDREGALLVGTPARNQSLSAPDRTIRSVKRQMGNDVQLQFGDQQLAPQEVSAVILRHLRDVAAKYLGQPLRKAVITVPAFFNDTQRAATREAGELAGLEVLRVINEPTAAALTYEPNSSKRETILVYDLGGGTFDVSIVQMEQGVVEVLSSHGDTQLGGDDFDQLLLDYVAKEIKRQHPTVNILALPTAKSRLLYAVEEAKKRLSFEPYTPIQEAFLAEHQGQPLNLDMTIDREEYEGLIESLVDKTLHCVDSALQDAKIKANQLDRVVLVGGSSRTPLVQRVLEARLGREPELVVEPDLCVSLGAAVQGGLIQGLDVGPVLVDITPHSFGIRTRRAQEFGYNHNQFAPIIRRNSALPVARSELFYTSVPGQTMVEVQVYQGEDEDVRNNTMIGKFKLEDLDPEADENSEILVRFDFDLDGTLTATAIERATSREKKLRIENAVTQFQAKNRQEARQRLNEIFGSEHEDVAELPAAAAVEVHAVEQRSRELLGRAAEKCPTASLDDAAEMENLTEEMTVMLREQNWEGLADACDKLEDVLFYLEGV